MYRYIFVLLIIIHLCVGMMPSESKGGKKGGNNKELSCTSNKCTCKSGKMKSKQSFNPSNANGCGPNTGGTWGKIINYAAQKLAVKNNQWDFNPICNWHDGCYSKCGVSRKSCDLQWYSKMLRYCKTRGKSSVSKCKRNAKIMTKAVKVNRIYFISITSKYLMEKLSIIGFNCRSFESFNRVLKKFRKTKAILIFHCR